MIVRPLLGVSIALLLFLSCESGTRVTQIENPDVTVVLKPIPSSLVEAADRVVEASETPIASRKETGSEFQSAQFVNRRKGWASTDHSIYATGDEGKSWGRLPFKTTENSRISSFFFIDESRGWLAVPKQVDHQRYGLGNSSVIFSTGDGGQTWSEQANFPNEVRIRHVSFLDAKRGLAIGARIMDQPASQGPAYSEILVLGTENGGETWNDISEPIKTAVGAVRGDSGWAVRWVSATEIFLLTRSGRILQTSNSGAAWKTIVKFRDERPDGLVSSTAYYKIVFDPQQQIRVIGGAMGEEGFWGDLVVSGNNNSWTSYELMRTPILDAVFLSANEVLASGMELRHVDDKSASGLVGVILQSLDCGKSWMPIYRSKSEEMFISLTRISDKEFYAVSDAGTFLKFELKLASQ